MSSDPQPVCKVQGPFIPNYAHAGDAGADLCSAVDDCIPPGDRKLISTGIRLALPQGHVGLIWPRSGLAVKQGIDCGAGVIDSGYRGEVRILLFNHSDQDFTIRKGDRIAQLLVQKVETAHFEAVDNLDDTVRGEKGFGSTDQPS